MALQAQQEIPQLLAPLQDAPLVQRLPAPQAAQQEPEASQPLAARSWDAQQVRVSAEPKPEPAQQTGPQAQQVSLPGPPLPASAEPLAPRDAAEAQPRLPSSG